MNMKAIKIIGETLWVIIATIGIFAFTLVRFLLSVFSLLFSVLLFFSTIIFIVIATFGTQSDWELALTSYFWFFICALVYGLMDEIEQKINNERMDPAPMGCFIGTITGLYMAILIGHYEIPKRFIMKVLGISKKTDTKS